MGNVTNHHRRSIRLPGFDYTQSGEYFITLVANNRALLFGNIANGEMHLNPWGAIIREEWLKTADLRDKIDLGAFVVMPNHFHGIVHICDPISESRGTARRVPIVEKFGQPVSGSIPTIIRAFKSAATKRIHEVSHLPNTPIWQRNYYEHIIGSDHEYEQIEAYIENNPANWLTDEEYFK